MLFRSRTAEGIAVNHRCDLVTAIVLGNVTDEKVRKQAHLFIESNTVQVWVNKQLETASARTATGAVDSPAR